MAATAAIVSAVVSVGSTAHQISESNNANRANRRERRRQTLLLAEQKAEAEAMEKAARATAEQTARNAQATRQRALLASGEGSSGKGAGKSGTLLTGPRGLGSTTLLGY